MRIATWGADKISHEFRSILQNLAKILPMMANRHPTADKLGGFYRSMQHHQIEVRFKKGVYERKETVETFSHAENGYLAALEGRAVLA